MNRLLLTTLAALATYTTLRLWHEREELLEEIAELESDLVATADERDAAQTRVNELELQAVKPVDFEAFWARVQAAEQEEELNQYGPNLWLQGWELRPCPKCGKSEWVEAIPGTDSLLCILCGYDFLPSKGLGV